MSRPKNFFPTAKGIPHAVLWHEGMLLAPQHFQQQALRTEALLHYHLRHASPFHWGIKRLEYDRRLLEHKGTFRVTELEALMPDGLVVSFQEGGGRKLELKLDESQEAELAKESQLIHLVILANKSSDIDSDGLNSRYREIQSPPLYDDYSKDLPLQIQQLEPWLRLHFGEPRESDCALPLIKLRKRVAGAPFEVSGYEAPRLDVPEHSRLGELCAEVSDRLQKKIGYLRNGLNAVAVDQGGFEQEVNRQLLVYLLTALPAFEAVRRTGLCHPFTVYVALCTLAGQVAALSYEKLPPTLSGYQHEAPYNCFKEVTDFILQCLEEGVPESFHINHFKATELGFELAFRPEWLKKRLVLGVVGPEQVSLKELEGWVHDCSIGSVRMRNVMRDNRTVGVKREQLSKCPELAPWGRMMLFELSPDAKDDADLFREGGETTLCVEHVLQGKRQSPHPAQLVLFTSKTPRPDSKS